MTWQAWVTLAVTGLTVIMMVYDVVAPSLILFGAAMLLMLVHVVTPAQALQGFSNTAPLSVAALYVLARAAEKTGALQPALRATLGGARGLKGSLPRLLIPVAASAAFFHSTAIVAMLVQPVTQWCERNRVSPSRYLMPVSYVTILGSVVTLMGTSTNLVVSGMLEASGHGPLHMFEQTHVGLPIALVGVVLVILLAPRVLPDRRPAQESLADGVSEFLVSMQVAAGGPLDGASVAAGGLRHLQGVFLVQVDRGGEVIAPVSPEFPLRGGDVLTFAGRANLVVDLQTMPGLVSAEAKHLDELDSPRHTFFQAVIGPASPLLGKTLRELQFRDRYQAAVVAIHRAGRRVGSKLGEVELRAADMLLILADPGFAGRWRDRGDFLLVARMDGSTPAASRKAWIVGLITLAIVVLSGLEIIPLFQASVIAAFALIGFGVLTPGEARNAVDLDVVVLIAASFGLGAAIEHSGLGAVGARLLLAPFHAMGPRGAILGIVLAMMILVEAVSHGAAAAVLFPIGMAAAKTSGVDPHTMAVAIAVSASCSFLTPIGYQTNTMVYGPGGYRFSDYARLGFPLTLVVITAIVWLV
ncbi:MAG TPA: SLC13 family permease [Gemmatimonadales bacterium]